MWGNSIGNRVAKVINQRVADAQKAHDEKCSELDTWCHEMKKNAEIHRDQQKEEHALDMVGKILGR